MKKKIKKVNNKPQKEPVYRKLFAYVIVVNYGLGDTIMQLLKKFGSNVQCDILGHGTANKEYMNILGLENNRKDIILAFVDETNVKIIKKELSQFFAKKKNKYYMGVGFTMPLTSIVGEKIYHFLTNTI